jgi:hypothetical protein
LVALFQQRMRAYAGIPPAVLGAFLGRVLLDGAAADPQIPSLVYEGTGGSVLGFIGSQVRPMVFDGRPIRLAAASHLVADAGERRPIGALLLRSFLTGRQDISVTDTATRDVERIWRALGGRPLYLGGIEWIRLLRPGAVAAHVLERRRGEALRPLEVAGAAVDTVLRPAARRLLDPPRAEVFGERLTAEALLEHMPELTADLRVAPDYGERYARWLLEELERPRPDGRLVATLVRRPERVLGWYVYRLCPNGLCPVAQIACHADDAGQLLDHLFEHAARNGAGGVRGKVEPPLLRAVADRRCALRHTGGRLVHTRDRELLGAIGAGSAMLSLLEGEWTALPWPSPAGDRETAAVSR